MLDVQKIKELSETVLLIQVQMDALEQISQVCASDEEGYIANDWKILNIKISGGGDGVNISNLKKTEKDQFISLVRTVLNKRKESVYQELINTCSNE